MRIAAFPFNRPTAFATLYLGGTEVLQSKPHSHPQWGIPVVRPLYKSRKIKWLIVFVVALWSRLHLGYDRLCKTSDGSHLRRSTCSSGYGNAETMERLGDCADDTGAVGVVLARNVDGRLLAHTANHAGPPGDLVHERVANLR